MDTFSCCEEVYDPGTGVLYFSEAVDPKTWPDYSIKQLLSNKLFLGHNRAF